MVFRASLPPDNWRTTSTGSFLVVVISLPFLCYANRYSVVATMDCSIWPDPPAELFGAGPQLAFAAGQGHQFVAGDFGQLVGSQHFQAAVDQPLRRYDLSLGTQPVDDGLDSAMGGVAHGVGGEVDALDQGAAVNPLPAGMPALHRRGVEQVLTHVADGQGHGVHAGFGYIEVADQSHGPHHGLGGTLHPW